MFSQSGDMSNKLSTGSLQSAVEQNILSAEQAKNLIAFLQRQPSTGPAFDFTHVLYYMGGLIAIGAMTLFMNLGWESFGGMGIVVISLIYATMGILLSNNLQAGLRYTCGYLRYLCRCLNPTLYLRISAGSGCMA